MKPLITEQTVICEVIWAKIPQVPPAANCHLVSHKLEQLLC